VRPRWEDWQKHPNSDLDHFKLICQLRQEVVHPHVTVVERDGQPLFFLVGRLERSGFSPSIGYFKPFRIPAKVLTVIYQGLLGPEDDEIAETLVRHLWSLLSSGEADAVAFHNLPEHSPLMRALLFHGPRWFCEKSPAWSNHWTMELPEEPGALLNKARSKHRSWIRKKQRDLEAAFPGKVSLRWLKSFDDIPDLCKRLEMVATRTYQRGLGAGFLDDEEYRQRFALHASRGGLRVQLLEIEGRLQAFWIGEVYRGIFHSSATGYNPDLRPYEPGTLVFMSMVDALVREGIRQFDFGSGEAFYKQRFGDRCWREGAVRIFAPTAKGVALRSSLGFFGLLDGAGRRLARKVGGVDRVKTGWRRRLAPSRPESEGK